MKKGVCNFLAVCLFLCAAPGMIFPEKTDVPGGPPGIGQDSSQKRAVIRFLGHCGFAVETPDHILVFDYVEKMLESSYPRPASRNMEAGYIVPEEIIGRKVSVFVTHEHGDHFDPVILDWVTAVPDIRYFFGWKASDEPRHHCLIGPRAEWKGEGLEIFTVNSHHSGVPEVAYLVKVGGLVVYFNGDYQGEFEEDYPYLKGKAERIDLAFMPPVWEEKWAYGRMTVELIRAFKPAAVFPMHVRIGDESQYFPPFEKAFQPRLEAGRVVLTNNEKGAAFVYERGAMRVLRKDHH